MGHTLKENSKSCKRKGRSMVVIHKKNLFLLLIISLSQQTESLTKHHGIFVGALVCAAIARTSIKVIRQAATNVGIISLLEDSQLFTTKTMLVGPFSAQVNPRKFLNRTFLAASLLALARTTGTTLTPATIYTVFGVAAGSAMSIGS